jgi:uncharacterized protein YceK
MKHRKMIMVLVVISIALSGCSSSGDSTKPAEEEVILQSEDDYIFEDSKKIAEIYRDIYEHGIQNGIPSLDMEKQIVQRLGKKGYVAIDNENQIDMVNSEKVKNFVEKVGNKEGAQLTIICVIYSGEFIRYDLQTKKGNLQVISSSFSWNESTPEAKYKEEYNAHTWVYSEEGYLFFEQYHMPGYDGPSGHTAIRVQPLDETCRELNRKYLMSVGYDLNNLFISNWNENNYQELDFYDLYEPLLQMKNDQSASREFLDEGVTYEVPKSEFEEVYETYFQIDSEALQQGTMYSETTKTYQYRTRGMYDFASTPNIPYPEVIAYEENEDGTIKLTVNAVWPEKNCGKAFSHEVVVRPLKDGGFQYVSNNVISWVENVEAVWYPKRLSDEKWREYYRGMQ